MQVNHSCCCTKCIVTHELVLTCFLRRYFLLCGREDGWLTSEVTDWLTELCWLQLRSWPKARRWNWPSLAERGLASQVGCLVWVFVSVHAGFVFFVFLHKGFSQYLFFLFHSSTVPGTVRKLCLIGNRFLLFVLVLRFILNTFSRQHLKDLNMSWVYAGFMVCVFHRFLPHLCCHYAFHHELCFLEFFLHLLVSIFILTIISPHTQFVCIVKITVGGSFESGLNTFTPTDKSVESLSFRFSILP